MDVKIPRPPSASPERTRARKAAQRRAVALFLKQYGVTTAEALVSKIISGELEIKEIPKTTHVK